MCEQCGVFIWMECRSLQKVYVKVRVKNSNPSCLPRGPGRSQVKQRWQIAANHLLNTAKDMQVSSYTLIQMSGCSLVIFVFWGWG